MSDSDFQLLTKVVAVALWAWPPLFAAVAAAVTWRRVKSPFAYLVFALLSCYGLNSLIGFLGLRWQLNFEPGSMSDRVVYLFIGKSIVTIVGASLLSVPLLYWLYSMLRRDR